MKKRLFTLCLATLLFAGALTGILVGSSANEAETFDPDSYDYDALYVGDAVIHFSAMDHKAGDTVDPTLATSEDGQQLLLEKINANMQTEWAYGDGYLEISTGSQLIASGIFAPADAENPEKGYTVEYIYGTVDKGLPQSVTFSDTYKKDAWYGAGSAASHVVGSTKFTTYYIKDDALSELKALSKSYLSCADSPILQSGFTFKPNVEDAGADADGVFGYAQTKALLEDATLKKTYYFLDMDYTNVGNSRVAKSVVNVGGTWKVDLDWKSGDPELFRMPFGEMRQLNFLMNNTLGADGNYTETVEIYKDFSLFATDRPLTQTFGSNNLGSDLVLAKDVGARVYAVRVYDRKLDLSEMLHNHVVDICRSYRLDPSFYTEAEESDREVLQNALASVRIGVDSAEAVAEAIEQAASSVLKAEKNVYTDLYVQDNLMLMINPMTNTKPLREGDLVTTISDLDGNLYPVGSIDAPASFTDRAVNLGLLQTLSFGNILPTEGSYTVRIVYANHLSPLPTEDFTSQVPKFQIGPAKFTINYARPSTDPSAKGGVTKGYLNVCNGQTGAYNWKNDFDTTWAGGAKQPDLFAVEYGQITEFVTEISFGADVTVNIYRDGVPVASASNTNGPLVDGIFTIGRAINTDIYAIMVYTDVLTEEQKVQNHFADLMSYYQVDMTMFEKITNEKVRERLYEALKNTKIGESSKDYLQGMLESFALTGGNLGVIRMDDYVTFEGIQSRIEDYASARALFSFNTKMVSELEKQGCEVELGTILMPVTEENSIDDLTIAYNSALGEYLASHEDAILKTAYRKGESMEGLYGFSSDEKRYFSATIPALDAATAGDSANQQYYMRAYLAVDYAGSNFVLYSNMESDIFGNSVSIREACDYFLFAGYAESDVLASLAGEFAAKAALATKDVALTAHEKFNIAALASKLIQAARDGANEAKRQNDVASSGITIEMNEIDAMRVGPLAASTKVQAELYATIGLEKYNVAKNDIVIAREAAEELSVSVYTAALAAGADEETAQAIRETATAQLLAMIGEVEAYVATAEPLAKEMQEILDAFKEYTALLQLSKVFPAKATIFINGTTLVRYTIITDNEHLAIAENLQKLLLEHIGNTVGIYNIDNQYVGSHFDYTSLNTIMLGITENEINGDGLNYAVYGEGKCVYIEGSDLETIEAATARFFKNYCAGTGRQQKTIDRGENAFLNQTYTPLIAFNYGESYPAVQCDSYDANGVWQVFLQKMQQLPEEINVIDTVEVEDIPDSLKNVYYVATDGNDKSDGKIDTPFKTLERALEEVVYCGGGTIYLRGGIYEIGKTVAVNASHSGTLTAPLYISAYPGEEVTFTSATVVDSALMQSVDQAIAAGLVDAKIKTRLNTFSEDNTNSNNVYVAKLNPSVHAYAKPVVVSSYLDRTQQRTPEEVNQLYIDGELFHVARWPNKGAEDEDNYITNGRIKFTDEGTVYDKNEEDVLNCGKVSTDTSSLYNDHKDDVGGWKIVFDNCLYKDHLLAYDKSVDLYTYAAVFEEWNREHFRLTLSVDENNRNIMESDTYCTWGCMEKAGNNMYFYNAIEDLDVNGEYYLDFENGLLYVYSDTPMTGKEILLSSSATTLLDIAGAKNVVVNGITFTKTMATGVTVRNGAERVIVQNCTFSDIKGSGITLNGRYCGMLKCDLSNTTSAMATITSPIETMVASYSFVQNCYFHDPNELVQTGLTLGGVGTVVSHNLFKDTVVNYSKSLETILEYNEFNRGSQITFDSGPVYLSGPADKKANHVRYNYFHDLNVSQYGIYFDDMCTGNYAYGNIIHYAEENSGHGKCVNLHSGNANVIYNNIGFNAENAGIVNNLNYYAKSIDGKSTGGGGLSYRWGPMTEDHLIPQGVDPELYALRFPIEVKTAEIAARHIADRALNPGWSPSSDKNSVADADEIFLRSDFFNVYRDNVMIHCGQNGYNLVDPGNTRIDERNLYYETPEEAGFVDYANYDFNLREDSVVWNKNSNFTKIPFDRMGRIEDLGK